MKKLLCLLFIFLTTEQFAQTGMQIVYTHTNCPITNDSITWVEIDSNNVKWVGTRDGLYSFDNITWTRYDVSNSTIPNNKIDMFRIAKDNSIWFVNNNHGFYKFQGGVFTLYNKSNLPGLTTDSLSGVVIDSLDIFFWTNRHGIIRYNSVTGAIYNIDTSNSYVSHVSKLAYHTNHTFYGIGNTNCSVNNITNRSDSIASLYNFSFKNTPNIAVNNDCFLPCILGARPCYGVFTDKFDHRFEDYDSLYGTVHFSKLRSFDKNNVCLMHQDYSHPPIRQMILSPAVFCLDMTNIYNTMVSSPPTPFYGASCWFPAYGPWSAPRTNIDIDRFNNLWIATYKGLVAYNDSALFLGNPEITKTGFLIYPNPTHSQLVVKGSINIERVSILNSLGEFIGNKNVTNSKIDVDELLPGIYFIGVIESGRLRYYKFSKQ